MSDRTEVATHAVAVVVLLAAAVYGFTVGVSPTPPPVGTPLPSASSTSASTLSPTPTAAASSPTPSPVASPTASRRPLSLAPYVRDRAYTAVTLGTGWTIVAPFDGRVEVHVYQLIDGTIREFTDAAGVPSYPYVSVTAADGRKITYRPGALTTDTGSLVRASQVKAGDDLFTVIGAGPSSWHDFYDRALAAQILVSLVTAAGADADAAPLIKAR